MQWLWNARLISRGHGDAARELAEQALISEPGVEALGEAVLPRAPAGWPQKSDADRSGILIAKRACERFL